MDINSKIKLFKSFERAAFKKRLNRFLVECLYEGKIIKAHLPNPGRLWELLKEGETVYLIKEQKDAHKARRNTDYTAVSILKDSRPVFLHTHKTNEIARLLIENKCIHGLEDYKIEKTEFSTEGRRFDFLLKRGKELMLLEVKSCTLFNKNFAMFPDAITSRGKNHVLSLTQSHIKGGILFVVHSDLPDYFLPEYHVDPEFARVLYLNRNEIFIKAVGIRWNLDLTFEKNVKALSIPWNIYEREGKDAGSYLLILKNNNHKKIKIGKLGEIFFQKGFYIYVGSAMKNLQARLERHKRKRKSLFWHIDYFREEIDLVQLIPIRSSVRHECELAKRIESISDGYVEGFGVSDCNCISHLFYVDKNPLDKHDFIETILSFRTPTLNPTQQKSGRYYE